MNVPVSNELPSTQALVLGMGIEDIPLVFDISTLARILGCSRSAAYVVASSPGFPLIKVPGLPKRIYKAQFLAWLERVSAGE